MADSHDKMEEDDHADTVPERTLHDSGAEGVPDLRILHFNDVYHPYPAEQEPKGGAARSKTLCDHYRDDPQFKDGPTPLTFFSGGAYNPSSESSVTKGGHMIPVLNELNIDAACAGNHEFDFGAAHFAYLAKDCNFPWLMANLYDPNLGEDDHGNLKPLGGCRPTMMLEASNGIKVGLMGLVEKEWTEKIDNSLPSNVVYRDMEDVAKELAPQLRKQGADIVIALTHARQPRDHHFCNVIPAGLIDIVLAGHDHWVEHKKFDNGTVLLRSGFDFKNLTYTEAFRQADKSWKFNIIRRNLTGDIEENETVKRHCEDIVADVHRKMDWPLGLTAVPLEARKEKCETSESNYGNFLADLMRVYHKTDCAIVTGGTFKGNRIYHSGQLYIRDIVECFSFEDPVVMIRVTGDAIREVLEHGVSKYPEPHVAFPQISNIVFSFDPTAKAGERIQRIKINGEELDPKRKYTVATRALLASGKRGYMAFRVESRGGTAEEVIDEENGVLVSGMLRQYFTWVQTAEAFKAVSSSENECVSHRRTMTSHLGRQGIRWNSDEEKAEMIKRKVVWKWRRLADKQFDAEAMIRAGEGEFFKGWTRGIAPKVEGRITMVH
ncbi:5'-nucleotidase like protein [Zymoseptoria brevis]|uniref:5'-nucleotidase like protein n=1 Tax=Zymoseptoria brevis TaxID=1047168 RepID=A0A0F4G435_9PEZI|nr:5'-nucleotidase like protein [Zymoseptoria brevis]